jgi:SAM-dependent methyltransferase
MRYALLAHPRRATSLGDGSLTRNSCRSGCAQWASRTQTQLFRTPIVPFLYERGWRDNFKRAGFPGIDAEYAEVAQFFAPVATDGVCVDMSCGSGLMTRRLLRSGAYRRVLALDYSETMLAETARRLAEEGVRDQGSLTLCRADVAALPLRPGSVDAMHAGAAMHCWPKLDDGLAEIHAALKPGGRFFATTFLQGAYGASFPRQTGGSGFRFFEDEEELKRLLVAAGFPDDAVEVRREGRGCAIIRAEKAPPPSQPTE